MPILGSAYQNYNLFGPGEKLSSQRNIRKKVSEALMVTRNAPEWDAAILTDVRAWLWTNLLPQALLVQ